MKLTWRVITRAFVDRVAPGSLSLIRYADFPSTREMILNKSTVTLFIFLSVLVACDEPASSSKQASADSLRALDKELQDAVARKDVERIMSFYDDDALMLPAAEPAIRGKDAIRTEWTHILAIPGFENEGQLISLDVSSSGDLAYTTGSYLTVMQGEDGTTVREPGKWVTVWKRGNAGAWRIVVDTYNTDVPPPDHK